MILKLKFEKPLVWYIKWIATVLVIISVACRSVEEIPRIYDLVFSFTGTIMWWWVSFIWNDRALLTLNTTLLIILSSGLLRSIFI
jgi:hypothetical protein